MTPWIGWTWTTATAARHSKISWDEWQATQRREVATTRQTKNFTTREEARLRFLRWYFTEHRIAS